MRLWDAESLWPEIRPLLDQFSAREDLTMASYRDVVLKTFVQGNLVVIGDAAHCTSPQLGQGANLALVDALILSTCINDCETVGYALKQYNKARSNHIRFYQIASRWLTPFFNQITGYMAN